MASPNYGTTSSTFSREYNMSPAYSTLGKSRDNYNRFETESHAAAKEAAARRAEEEASKFSGFGDRPGSGVELTKHTWAGGEIVTDPSRLPRGPKPRRFYYSPIGDGTVAADGIELKKKPADLNPRVTVTQLTHVERGKPGYDGLNEYIKTWSSGGSAPASEADLKQDLGGLGSPTNGSRASPYDKGAVPDGRQSASSMFSDPGYRYTDIQHGYAITNPRELIHQYATTTPVAVMEVADNTPGSTTTATYKKKVTTRIEERQGGNVQGETYSPYPPYRSSTQTVSETRTMSPNNFVRKLRDDTMTNTQREANTHIDPQNLKDPNATQKIQDIKQKTAIIRGHDEIDSLTSKMMEGLRNTPTPSRY